MQTFKNKLPFSWLLWRDSFRLFFYNLLLTSPSFDFFNFSFQTCAVIPKSGIKCSTPGVSLGTLPGCLKGFFYDLYCFRLSYLVAVFWKGMVGTLRSCLHFNYVHLFLELIELHHLASVGWGCVFDLIYQCTVSFLFFLKKGLFNVFSVIGIECWLKWISFKGCFIFSAYILKNLHLIVKLLYI